MGLLRLPPREIVVPASETFDGAVSDINFGALDAAFSSAIPHSYLVLHRTQGAGEVGFGYILAKVPSAAATGARLYIDTGSGLIGWGLESSGASNGPAVTTTLAANADAVWWLIGVTTDGTANTSGMKVYAGSVGNGNTLSQRALTDSVSGSGNLISTAANEFHIGNRAGTDRTYNGQIGYIARWNRVLSQSDFMEAFRLGPLAFPDDLVLCWSGGVDYGPRRLLGTSASVTRSYSNRSRALLNTIQAKTFYVNSGSDTTAPVLTSPTGTATGSTTATVGATTDEGNGTLYAVVSTSNTAPSAAQIKAGQMHTGSAAAWSGSTAVSSTGTKTLSATGLTAATAYYAHLVHTDAATNDSAVVTSTQFTTSAATVKGVEITLYTGSTPQASVTGIRALWWDATQPDGTAPDYYSATESTDGSGVLSIDIDAVTTLSVGDYGFLLLYKLDGIDYRDSLAFAGQVQVSDIA